MTNHEIESKLRDKADKYEVHSLQTEIRELKQEVQALERKVSHIEGTNHNRYALLDRLLNLLSEQPSLSDVSSELQELKRYL